MRHVDPSEREAIELAGHLQAPRFHAMRSFHGIRAAALSPANPFDALYAPLDWQCRALLTEQDFDAAYGPAGVYPTQDHDRWFLMLCAEVLYGDYYCPDLATEIELVPPQPGNRTHMEKLGTV